MAYLARNNNNTGILDNNAGNLGPGFSGGAGVTASLSGSIGSGRDSLVLLAALVVGVIALSYWTR